MAYTTLTLDWDCSPWVQYYTSHTAQIATLYQMQTSKFYLSIDFMQCLIIAEKDCDWPKRMTHVPRIRALVGLQVMVGEPKRIWETKGGKWNSPVLGAGHCWWSQSWGQHLDCTEWARSFWNMITCVLGLCVHWQKYWSVCMNNTNIALLNNYSYIILWACRLLGCCVAKYFIWFRSMIMELEL